MEASELPPTSKGKAIIGYATDQQYELEMVDFVQAEFSDNRLISVAELEDGTFTLCVENPQSSGRNPHQAMRLGKESFMALVFCAHLYCQGKGIDMIKSLEDATEKKDIDYRYSDGIEPINFKDV